MLVILLFAIGSCVKTNYPICLQFNALFVIICITLFNPTIWMVFLCVQKHIHLGQITSKKIQCIDHIQQYGSFTRRNQNVYDYFFIHVTPPIHDNCTNIFYQDDFKDSRSFMTFHASSCKNVVCNYYFWIFMYNLFQLLQQSWSYSSMLECQQHGMEYFTCKNIGEYQVPFFASNEVPWRKQGNFIK